MGFGTVSNDLPIAVGNDDLQLKRRSDTGLIEAREESVTKEWLTMREDVHFLVLRVLVMMQTRTVAHICVLEGQRHLVLTSGD